MTRFVVHHDALLHLATIEAAVSGEHELLSPTSVRSHLAVEPIEALIG